MANLESAQILGGVAVTIEGDLSKLRSAAGEARVIAQNIERSIVIRLPVQLDFSAARSQLVAFQAALQNVQLQLPGPGMGGPNGGSPGGGSGGSRWVNSTVIGSGPNAGGGSPNGGGGGPPVVPPSGPGWFSRNFPTIGRAGRLNRLVSGGVLAFEALRLAKGYSDYRTAMTVSRTGEDQLAAEQGFQSTIEGIPLVGQAAGLITDNFLGGRDLKVQTAGIVDEAKRRDLHSEEMVKRGIENQKIVQQTGLAHRVIGMTSSERAIETSRLALEEFDTQNGVDNGDVRRLTPTGRAARTGLTQAMTDAVTENRQRSTGVALAQNFQVTSEKLRIAAVGQFGPKALESTANAEVNGTMAQRELALSGTQNVVERKRIIEDSEQEIALIRARYAKDDQQLSRERGSEIIQTETAQSVSRLRVAKDFYKADLEAFDGAAKAKLALIADPEARANAEAQLGAQRSVLVAGQNDSIANIKDSLRGRVASANARGAGMEDLASVLGEITGMRQELRGAPNMFRADMINAQTAELMAIEKQVLSPNRFATEFDPAAEAKGGPSGQAGDEQVQLLSSINDYLREIAGKSGGYQ